MKFPWNKYIELPLQRRNTLQVFITNKCNLRCEGCFARNVMEGGRSISIKEYEDIIKVAIQKGCEQINILGGEPLLHPELKLLLKINKGHFLKTTIYTNGLLLYKYKPEDFKRVKLRVSFNTFGKSIQNIPLGFQFDANPMISANTTLEDLLNLSNVAEHKYKCRVFFLFSMRELDNPQQEFFVDTENTGSVIWYKELVHKFLIEYEGNMDIHISKRGVFESTKTLPDNKCRFANYFIGGKVIQCPYDVINLKYQDSYQFGKRYCQQNNTCLMSKIILRPIRE